MFKKSLVLLCVMVLLVSYIFPAYAEQRITGCGFVDDDCFAGGVKTESDTWRGQHFDSETTQLTYSKEKGEPHELEANG